MMRNKLIRSLPAMLFVFLLAGCVGSTQLIQSWHDENFKAADDMETVLVLGVFRDDIRRRAFESKFVELVSQGGKQAIAGYTLMPEEADYDEESDVAAAVDKVRADAVLITSYKGTDQEQRYVPPSYDYVPAMGYGRYGAYYGSAFQAVYRPGYTVVDEVVSLETRIYSVNPEQLVWAGKTKSVNSSSGDKIVEELVKIVTDDMRENGLIE